MCQKGVNTEQLLQMIAMSEDTLGMTQQWLEQIHHLADHGGLAEPSAAVAQASVLLGEVRAKLESATEQMRGEQPGPDASVELV